MATAEREAPATAAWPRRWRWSKDQYLRLRRENYFVDCRVELVDGEIVVMTSGEPHVGGVTLGYRALDRAFGNGYYIRVQAPLDFGEDRPEPDVAVVPGDPTTVRATPTTALLVVEVSDTTLAYDLGRKARLYAERGVADYWVLDVSGRRLVVHRAPGPGGYADLTEHAAGASVEPLARPGRPVAVSDLLP